MKIRVDEDGNIVLSEVYNEVIIETGAGSQYGVCLRDGGLEVSTPLGEIVTLPATEPTDD